MKTQILFTIATILLLTSATETLFARQRLIDSLAHKLTEHRAKFGDDTTTVQILYVLSEAVALRDPREREIYGKQVVELSKKLNYLRGIICGELFLAKMAQESGKLDTVLKIYEEALLLAKKNNEVDMEIQIESYMSSVLGDIGELAKSLEHAHIALKRSTAFPSDENFFYAYHALVSAYFYLELDTQMIQSARKCLDYAQRTGKIDIIYRAYARCTFVSDSIIHDQGISHALDIAQSEGWTMTEGVTLLNMGWSAEKNPQKAFELCSRSLSIFEKLHSERKLLNATSAVASSLANLKRYNEAIPYALRSIELCKKFKELSVIMNNAYWLSISYEKIGNYQKAMRYMDTVRILRDSLVNAETMKKTTAIEVKAATEKKNVEIALIEQEKKNITLLRNATIIGLLLVVIIALLLYRSYRLRKKSDEENHALLLNVLPASIAERLKSGERRIAEKHLSVSILFADIVDFTRLSQRISAEELVELLNEIFSVIDDLANKYKLEKIKTIGDCYMVVSGLPTPNKNHAINIVDFAFELQTVMEDISKDKSIPIRFRIGIHSGEAVAGVIGKKKFLYDLWGDAVNTASRMESHGVAGKIHISEEFKQAVEAQCVVPLQFIQRGELEIKGKGVMRTYFLEKI